MPRPAASVVLVVVPSAGDVVGEDVSGWIVLRWWDHLCRWRMPRLAASGVLVVSSAGDVVGVGRLGRFVLCWWDHLCW